MHDHPRRSPFRRDKYWICSICITNIPFTFPSYFYAYIRYTLAEATQMLVVAWGTSSGNNTSITNSYTNSRNSNSTASKLQRPSYANRPHDKENGNNSNAGLPQSSRTLHW